MLTIESNQHGNFSLLRLGFRPFFLLAATYATAAMALWGWFYLNQIPSVTTKMSSTTWHAHEMVYGYTMAVVCGFLLTAIRNWTSIQTLTGKPLFLLAMLWLLARTFAVIPNEHYLAWAVVFDLAFNLLFLIATAFPLVKARQWKQFSIWSKLLFLLAGNIFFYAGIYGWMEDGVRIGLYTGLYVIVSLVLLMGRRVIPFFIEKRGGENIVNRKWLDIGSLALMLLFLVVEVYWLAPTVAAITALLLFLLHATRMSGWYSRVIWREPMLWVLYIGYGWIVFAFLLRGLVLFFQLNPMSAVHAFAAGGIGMITVGMMARVSLGHTGRDVYAPSAIITSVFVLIGLAAVFRVLVPMFIPAAATYMIMAAQTLWLLGFALFVFAYLPILLKPRVDGRLG